MVVVADLNEMLNNLLYVLPDLLAALVIDSQGLVIGQQSREEIDEATIGAVTIAVEPMIKKIKDYTETFFGSGMLDTDDYRLYFMELKSTPWALFVLVTTHFSNINEIIFYSYITAEKISLILNERETTLTIPKFSLDGKIELDTSVSSIGVKNIFIRVIILGNTEVGKTALLNSYINGNVLKDYKPTIGVSYEVMDIEISKKVKLTFLIFDISGHKSYAKARSLIYPYTDTVVVLFDSSRIETLNNAKQWIEESRLHVESEEIPYFLIANKIDLIFNREAIRPKAKSIAENYKCNYYETSAITGEGIDELFTQLLNNFVNKIKII